MYFKSMQGREGDSSHTTTGMKEDNKDQNALGCMAPRGRASKKKRDGLTFNYPKNKEKKGMWCS